LCVILKIAANIGLSPSITIFWLISCGSSDCLNLFLIWHARLKPQTNQILLLLTVLSIRHLTCTIFIWSLYITSTSAQIRYIQGSLHAGSIVNHNSDISFNTDALSFGCDLAMYWQTSGERPWHQLQKFPRLHLTASYQDLGQKDIVGAAIMLTGGIEANIFRKSSSALHFGFGSGFAYLTKPFDRITNPTNNAIGSHLNNTVTLKLDYERLYQQKLILHFGVKLFHYSNGARTLPNLGLNIPSVYIGLSPNHGSYEKDFFQIQEDNKRTKEKIGFSIHAHYAQVEIRVPGGPKYPVYIYSADAYYSPNPRHRLTLGYQYDYNKKRRLSFLVPRPFYFQLAPRYYFNAHQSGTPKIFASIQLKSHLFVAEHISFGLGLVF